MRLWSRIPAASAFAASNCSILDSAVSAAAPFACPQGSGAARGTDFAHIVVGTRDRTRRPDSPATVLRQHGRRRRAEARIGSADARPTRCARDDPPTRGIRRRTADRAPHARTRGARAQNEGARHVCRHHAPAARQRRPLRPPDPPVEPEDEALHPHRAQRHLHHRPPGLAGLHRPRLRGRQVHRGPRRHDPLRRHQEAGAGDHRRAGDPGEHALREPPLARRHAHQLRHGLQADRPHEGARADRLRRRRRLAVHQEGAAAHAPRAGQARAHPGRHPEPVQDPVDGLGRGHQEGAPRDRRGAEARHPGRRDPGHQLRSR